MISQNYLDTETALEPSFFDQFKSRNEFLINQQLSRTVTMHQEMNFDIQIAWIRFKGKMVKTMAKF